MEQTTPQTQAYFVALTPDSKLEARVAVAKLEILTRFGNQTYLEVPPHLTFYVALTNDIEEVKKRLEVIAFQTNAIRTNIVDWQVFEEDELAGGGTSLGLRFSEQDIEPIINIQKRVVDSLNELRQGQIYPRYKGKSFPQPLKESLEKYGYPFVLTSDNRLILIPHISFCTFNPPEYARQFQETNPISKFIGPTTLNRLSLYKLSLNEKAELVKHFLLC